MFALAAHRLRLDNGIFEAAYFTRGLCSVDQPRVYYGPCSCCRWRLDLLHTQACSNDAVAAIVLRRIRLGIPIVSRRRHRRLRTLALGSEVAFWHRNIYIGMPSPAVLVGCFNDLKLDACKADSRNMAITLVDRPFR